MDLSPGWLLSSLLVGTLGMGLFLYGKKQTRLPQLLTGVALMLESTFVPSPTWMFVSAGLAVGVLWGALRAGL